MGSMERLVTYHATRRPAVLAPRIQVPQDGSLDQNLKIVTLLTPTERPKLAYEIQHAVSRGVMGPFTHPVHPDSMTNGHKTSGPSCLGQLIPGLEHRLMSILGSRLGPRPGHFVHTVYGSDPHGAAFCVKMGAAPTNEVDLIDLQLRLANSMCIATETGTHRVSEGDWRQIIPCGGLHTPGSVYQSEGYIQHVLTNVHRTTMWVAELSPEGQALLSTFTAVSTAGRTMTLADQLEIVEALSPHMSLHEVPPGECH